MKKELIAGLILILLFSASLINVNYLDRMITDLIETVDSAQAYCDGKNWALAAEEINNAINSWESGRNYTHIFIRHTEIDCTTDAFYDMLGAALSMDTAAVTSSRQKLVAHLKNISKMEQLSLGSIF